MNEADIPKNNSKTLAGLWTDFINWERRRAGEAGFLIENLRKYKCKLVFDACLGDGADSVHLIQNGFTVTSNDIDELFIKKALANAKKHAVSLDITRYDWRKLERSFKENTFDAVLCQGNSLTYLFRESDRFKTLGNFYHILKRDGILIIDERNYQYILDGREEILKKGRFRYSNRYVYCGDTVHGKPIEISEGRVLFEYVDERTKRSAYLSLYPFKRGELLGLLTQAGFRKIEQYSDYKKGFDETADFYQYVCLK